MSLPSSPIRREPPVNLEQLAVEQLTASRHQTAANSSQQTAANSSQQTAANSFQQTAAISLRKTLAGKGGVAGGKGGAAMPQSRDTKLVHFFLNS